MFTIKFQLPYGLYKLNNFLAKKCHRNMLKMKPGKGKSKFLQYVDDFTISIRFVQ